MNLEELGFVLSITPYREHDGMVQFLGETIGLVRLILPGYYKANSKQGSLGLEFTHVRYRMKDFRPDRLNRIISGEMVNGFRHERNDYDWLLLMSLMAEVSIKMYDSRYQSVFYEGMMHVFHEQNHKEYALYLLRDIIELHGFKPYVDGCVVCDKKQVNDFSVEKGGFLCPDHVYSRGDKEILGGLYQLFTNADTSRITDEAHLEGLFQKCVQYIIFHGDIRLQSWKLWNQ